MGGFLILLPIVVIPSFVSPTCCCSKFKVKILGCSKVKDRVAWGLAIGLGIVSAFNFGLGSIALMLLSQADLQVFSGSLVDFL